MKQGHESEVNAAAGTDERRGGVWERFLGWLTGPVEVLPLRVFEIWFAVTFPARLTRNFPIAEWLTEEGYHVTAAQWRGLGYPEAFPLLPLWGAWLFIAVVFLAVAGLAGDLKRRKLWLGVLLASAIYAQGVDYLAATSANKQFIAVFFILFTGPSLWRCPNTGRGMVSAAALRALQGTILVIYFSAGWAKAFDGDWLKFDDVLYTQVQGSHRTEFAAWALRSWPLWFWTLNQYLALVFELGAPLLLGVRKLRPIGFAMGIGMHVVIALTMFQLVYFSVQMWAYYALFVSAVQWREVARLFSGMRIGSWAAATESARRFVSGWLGGNGSTSTATVLRLKRRTDWRSGVYLASMVGVWLIPFFYVGWKGGAWRLFPTWWRFQHSAAGLFTQRSTVWWDHHLEGRFGGEVLEKEKENSERAGEGVEALDERGVFAMGAFGYRTRLDRILNESDRSVLKEQIRERLGAHVALKLNGEGGRGLEEVRLVRSLWRVGGEGMAKPDGAWNPPDVTKLGDKQRVVLGSYRVVEDGRVMVLAKEKDGAKGESQVGAKAVGEIRRESGPARMGSAVANQRIQAAKAMMERMRAEGKVAGPSDRGKGRNGEGVPGGGGVGTGRMPPPPPPIRAPGGVPLKPREGESK